MLELLVGSDNKLGGDVTLDEEADGDVEHDGRVLAEIADGTVDVGGGAEWGVHELLGGSDMRLGEVVTVEDGDVEHDGRVDTEIDGRVDVESVRRVDIESDGRGSVSADGLCFATVWVS